MIASRHTRIADATPVLAVALHYGRFVSPLPRPVCKRFVLAAPSLILGALQVARHLGLPS
jgi:hypothetical protein